MPSNPLFRSTKLYEKLISNSCYNGRGGIWLSYCKNMKKNSKFCTHTKQATDIFCYSFYFTKRKPLKNDEKCFLFNVKCSFRSWGINFFVFPSSPQFLPCRSLQGELIEDNIHISWRHKVPKQEFQNTYWWISWKVVEIWCSNLARW